MLVLQLSWSSPNRGRRQAVLLRPGRRRGILDRLGQGLRQRQALRPDRQGQSLRRLQPPAKGPETPHPRLGVKRVVLGGDDYHHANAQRGREVVPRRQRRRRLLGRGIEELRQRHALCHHRQGQSQRELRPTSCGPEDPRPAPARLRHAKTDRKHAQPTQRHVNGQRLRGVPDLRVTL